MMGAMARSGLASGARSPWPRSAWIAAFAGVLLTALAVTVSIREPGSRARAELRTLADASAESVNNSFQSARSAVRAVRALWGSSELVESQEFASFADELVRHDASILDVRFYALDPTARIAARGDGGAPGFGHDRLGRSFTCTLSADQVEAFDALVARVREASDACVSRDPFGEPGAEVSVVAAQLATNRAGELSGVIVVRFGVRQLLEHALPDQARRLIAVEVVERDSDLSVIALDEPPRARGASANEVRALELDGVPWSLHVSAGREFTAGFSIYWSFALLAFGLVSTALIVSYLRRLDERGSSLSRANAELYSEIGERHTIEKELRETQRALSTLVSNLQGVVYRCRNDTDWTMEFISDGCIAVTGYTPNDFLSGRVSFGQKVVHVDDRAYVWNAVQQALDAKRPFLLRYRITARDGAVKWVAEQGRGVFSRAGELLALEGFITDISEQVRVEEDLRRASLFTQATIESLPGTYYVFDQQGQFLRWNHNVERVTGYTAVELARMQPLDFFAPDDHARVAAALTQVFETGATEVEAALLCKDGSRLPFYFTGRRLELDGRLFLVGVGLDITERDTGRAAWARAARNPPS
jgi:PAS domain S-box-containing protein